jgi:hypothetical protein
MDAKEVRLIMVLRKPATPRVLEIHLVTMHLHGKTFDA